jgi:hypothetical protein
MGQTRQERQDKLFTRAMKTRAISGLVFYAKDILEQLDQFPQISKGINRAYLVEYIGEVEKRAL